MSLLALRHAEVRAIVVRYGEFDVRQVFGAGDHGAVQGVQRRELAWPVVAVGHAAGVEDVELLVVQEGADDAVAAPGGVEG